MVAGVVAVLEAKDPFTADHSLRVSDMTERVCMLLGLLNLQSEMIHGGSCVVCNIPIDATKVIQLLDKTPEFALNCCSF